MADTLRIDRSNPEPPKKDAPPQDGMHAKTTDIVLGRYEPTKPVGPRPGSATTTDIPLNFPPPPFGPQSKDGSETRIVNPMMIDEGGLGPMERPLKDPREWPVAVLVVIGGRMKGSVLPVPPGNSTLGRNRGNRIVMEDDPYVSQHKHISLSHFEDEDNIVVVTPGSDGSGVAYLNDKCLTTPTELKSGDRIRLTSKKGNNNPTELMFISVCHASSERSFSW